MRIYHHNRHGRFAIFRALPGSGTIAGHPRRSLVLSSILTLLVVMVCSAAPAGALESHTFSLSIGEPGSGAGELSGPQGVAVNATTHDVYVADTGNDRIDEFEANGTFVRAWGWGVADGISEKLQTCTLTCFTGLSGSGPGQFERPDFIAVDNSTGASKGDVYVGDTDDNFITKFSESGALIESWGGHGQAGLGMYEEVAGVAVEHDGTPVAISRGSLVFRLAADGSVSEHFEVARGTAPLGLAVDDEGNLFKLNLQQTVEEITSKGDDVGQATTIFGTGVAVDSTTGGLYFDARGGEIDHYAFSSLGVVSEPGGGTCTVAPETGCEATDHFGGTKLEEARGLAVDSSNADVYVADPTANQIDVFTPAALPDAATEAVSNLQTTTATLNGSVNPEGVATTYQFVYGTTTAYGTLDPVTPAGAGADSSNHTESANVSGLSPNTVYHYRIAATDASGTYYGQDKTFETAGPPTLEGEAAVETSRTQSTIQGAIDPHGFDTHYMVEYGTSAAYGASTATTDVGSEAAYQTVSTRISGLQPGRTYHYRIVASSSQGAVDSPDLTLTTPESAPIEEEAASSLSATRATVTARIDAFGEPTSYTVEYGTSESYGSSTSQVGIGAPAEFVPVMTQLVGLQPSTEYHFRFRASNGEGITLGPDMTFKTPASVAGGSSALPDDRVYELVSPAGENQTVDSMDSESHAVYGSGEDELGAEAYRASADGNGLAYAANPPREGGNGAMGGGQSNEWIAKRGANGWSAEDITPTGTDSTTEYSLFSESLEVGVFFSDDTQPIPSTPSPPMACGRDLNGDIYTRTADGSYHALVSQPGTGPHQGCGEPADAYTSADGSHVLFEDEAALTAGAAVGVQNESPYTLGGGYNIYDSVDGVLHQVNILPDGQPEPAPAAWIGSGIDNESDSPDYENAVSANGSRVIWSSNEITSKNIEGRYQPKALYVRENDTQLQSPIGPNGECTVAGDACTVQIDKGEARCVAEGKCASGGGLYWTASSDSTKVFFTACNKLTADATAIGSSCIREEGGEEVHNGEDLYEYDLQTEQTTDLTVDPGEPLGADVQAVIGAGEDGSYMYFVARGVLTHDANIEGKQPASGELNLYVRHAGVTTFIATLTRDVFRTQPQVRDEARSPSDRTAAVSATGQSVVFEASAPLTGYDNIGCGVYGEDKCPEVYVYEALNQRLACASCNPDGAPPSPPSEYASPEESLLPVDVGNSVYSEQYTPRWLSDNGDRVFFETAESLVPQDTNGRIDVYEWEHNGSGSCPAVGTVEAEPGCVYLISGGQSTDNSFFADADPDGDNVFFTSRADLTPQATTESISMYDARVHGGFPQTSLACTGTGCQGVPPAPPTFATPSSVTFNGVGNFSPAGPAKKVTKKAVKCAKGKKLSRGKCVKVKGKKKKTKAKKAKNSSTYRRAK
jgi:hypothetical protein